MADPNQPLNPQNQPPYQPVPADQLPPVAAPGQQMQPWGPGYGVPPHPMYEGLHQPMNQPGQPMYGAVDHQALFYSPEDEKIRNVAAAVFWLAIVQTVFLIISVAVGSFWIVLVLIILLICGFIGAWKYNRGLVIAFMVYQGLIIIFCIVSMALWPEAGVIVGGIITMIFAGVVFGISLWLVKLLKDKTDEERSMMSANFKICCC